MKQVVRDAFVPLTVGFEGGYIGWLFPDIEGKVSTGFGLLMEPVSIALALPWRRADGSLASHDEVVADWHAVKSHTNAARLGHRSVERVAKLRLDRAGLDQAFDSKLAQHDAFIRRRFADFEDWCADAQLAIHSQAWACGPAAWSPGTPHGFPKMGAALDRRDWAGALAECHMNEWDDGVFNAGLVPRNKANKVMLANAARVDADGLDPDALYWPRNLAAEPAPTADVVDTDDDRIVVPADVKHHTFELLAADAIAEYRKTRTDDES